jgi:hypothetical protein
MVRWTDGWHDAGESFRYLVEDGYFKRAVRSNFMGETAVYPYLPDKKYGGYTSVNLKANKRNWERISWH